MRITWATHGATYSTTVANDEKGRRFIAGLAADRAVTYLYVGGKCEKRPRST